MGEPLPNHLTFEFKKVSDVSVAFDLYLPPQPSSDSPIPVLIWWHGGGLTFGDRKTWFPMWLYQRAMQARWAFVLADYRLMPPGTSHDLLEDVTDLIAFISVSLNNRLAEQGAKVDPNRIAVGGMSAGAYAAYLAAAHACPKPKAVLSIYGMGGNLIIPNYLVPKTSSFFLGTPLLDPVPFSMFMHPHSSKLPALSGSPPVTRGSNTPAALRMNLAQFYVQQGIKLDYMAGEHDPSLSSLLRPLIPPDTAPPGEAVKVINSTVPARHHALFPQLFVADFPATFLVHGEIDSVVNARESRNLHAALQNEGVKVVWHELKGIEHLWDFEEGAEERWKDLMDEGFAFLVKYA